MTAAIAAIAVLLGIAALSCGVWLLASRGRAPRHLPLLATSAGLVATALAAWLLSQRAR